MLKRLKQIHDAYLSKREASVTPNAELKVTLEQQLFPSKAREEMSRGWWWTPSFAMVAVVVLAIVLQRTVEIPVAMSPGPADQASESPLYTSEDDADQSVLEYYLEADDGVMLFSGRQELYGKRGSYCDATMCVDMVAPEFDPAEYQYVSARALVLLLPHEATTVSVSLRDQAGQPVACDAYAETRAPRIHDIRLCAHADERYQLDVQMWYAEGGDAMYTYPIDVQKEH